MFIYMYPVNEKELLQERKAWRRGKYEVEKIKKLRKAKSLL